MIELHRRLLAFAAISITLSFAPSLARGQNDPCEVPRDPGEPFRENSVSEREGFILGEKFRLNLLLMRDHPEVIDRYGERMAKRQLEVEKRARAASDDIVQYPSTIPRFNSVHPAFTFDWTQLKESEAASVYLSRETEWPFLARDKDWNPHAPLAWAGVFVFPRSLEVDRDPQYAAREAEPLLKAQILSLARQEPVKLWFPFGLSPSDYTFDENTRTLHIGRDILLPPGDLASPQGKNGREYYSLPGVGGSSNSQWKAGGYRLTFDELENWRSMPDFLATSSDVSLDRQIHIDDLKLPGDYKTVASFSEEGNFLRFRMFLTFRRGETKGFLEASVNKIELVDLSGKTIVSLSGNALPVPGKFPFTAPHAFHGSMVSAMQATKIANCRIQLENHERTERHVAALKQEQKKRKEERETERQARVAASPQGEKARHQQSEADRVRGNLVHVFRILEASESQKGPARPSGSVEQGTGILLDNQDGTLQVLTANHVVSRSDPPDEDAPANRNSPLFIALGSDRTTEVPAQVVCRNEDSDIAVLVARVPLDLQRFIPKEKLSWSPKKSLEPGQAVWLIDSDGRTAPNTLIEVGQAHRSNSQGKELFYTSNSVTDGFSGGPVLNDDGAIIAVHAETKPGIPKTGSGTSIERALEIFNTQCFRSVRTNFLVEQRQ